jgi:5,10-methylenetetrahydromethanopterin reductase
MSKRAGIRDVGICLAASRDPRATARLAAMAEEAGFDHVWVTDTQGLWRDTYVTLTLVASATTSVRIGTMVTNPVTRHPSVTAGAIASLDEASDGRAVLGLGAGRSSVRLLGQRESLEACRSAAREIRALLDGETVVYGGTPFSLAPELQRQVPIYLSASGPKMLRVAAAEGEGVIFVVGATTELVDYAMRNVGKGLLDAGKARLDTYLVNYVQCSMGDSRSDAYDAARAMAGFHWREITVPKADAGVPEPPAVTYDYESHYSVSNDIRTHVPDEVVERFVVAGTPPDVADRLEALAQKDLDQLTVYSIGDTEEFLKHAHSLDLVARLQSGTG